MKEKNQAASEKPVVLIVEDNTVINKAYSAKFAHDGIMTEFAEDGEEALQRLKSGRKPALILLDLMLPKKSGFEVLEEIRQDSRLQDIPVIILTNLAQELDTKRGLALGAKEYLIKANIKIEDLMNKVKKYLAAKK
jgi:CheY-like chemotaxis protein